MVPDAHQKKKCNELIIGGCIGTTKTAKLYQSSADEINVRSRFHPNKLKITCKLFVQSVTRKKRGLHPKNITTFFNQTLIEIIYSNLPIIELFHIENASNLIKKATQLSEYHVQFARPTHAKHNMYYYYNKKITISTTNNAISYGKLEKKE